MSIAPLVRQGAVTRGGRGEVVTGMVMMVRGENSRRVVEAAKAKLDEIRRTLPPGVDIEIRPLPNRVEILVGDVTKVANPKSGRDMNAMAPLAVPGMMKDYGLVAATRSLPLPRGWVIPKNNLPRMAAAVERLRLHGITMVHGHAAAGGYPVGVAAGDDQSALVQHHQRGLVFLNRVDHPPHDHHRVLAVVAVDRHQVAALPHDDDRRVRAAPGRVDADDDWRRFVLVAGAV